MKHVIALALIIIPCAAQAAPIYLKCQLNPGATGGGGGDDLISKAPMDVTLNEEAGTVTYLFPGVGRAYTVRAAFTSDKVTFNGFTVNRTNFVFQRDMSALQAPGRPAIIDEGRCWLAEVKRAF
ncbi:hypothetical protein [Sphingomonas oligoaromativorans]|uniref:hypothetical protein n=1 Tax=Sphingomonas oligoaromativorans TaxID=575322 RepID=UPI00141F9341|nr:hypothetical protein [Sphingomonas oligoaromativorans]NIJ34951.1 hypothetical protein [Sphingomonas oligoaromativorans]